VECSDLMKGIPKQLADLETRAAGDADAAARARLDQQLRVQAARANSLKDPAVSRLYEVLEGRADR
jgi:hypothetical protein